MTYHYLLGHGELALKGKNRSFFEKRLADNINRKARRDSLPLTARLIYGKILVKTELEERDALDFLKGVFGIATIRGVTLFPYDYDALKDGIAASVKGLASAAATFRITTNRAFKMFQKTSMEVSREIGGVILDAYPTLKVDLFNPELEISIDIRSEGFFVSCGKTRGAGGFPEGTQGKALLLLSGGIDSPAAGYSAMKKGLSVDAVYFHTPPFTSGAALEKVRDLAAVLKRHSARASIRLFVVDIAGLQAEIVSKCEQSAATILLRAAMIRTAAAIAKKGRYEALVTGDSLGQVASQTLRSLSVADGFSDMFIIRPLIGMDKSDIIELSKKIGAFEISCRPFEDCCTLFVPKHPLTKPDPLLVAAEFDKLDYDSFAAGLDSCLETEEI